MQQAEIYKSTVSHEMRTPLQSMIYLVSQILMILQRPKELCRDDLNQACRYGNIITS